MQRTIAGLTGNTFLLGKVASRMRSIFAALILFAPMLLTAAPIQFQDVSGQAGFTLITPTYGAAWGDVNGDGWPDLFSSNHARRNSIYINNQDGTFTDSALSIETTGYWTGSGAWEDTHGGSWADYDNDGDKDLVVSTGNCCDPQVYENTFGNLAYRTIEKGFGNDVDKGGRMPVWFDMDDDGLLETLIASFYPAPLMKNEGASFQKLPWSTMECKENQFAVLLDYNVDKHLDIICTSKGGPFAQNAAYDFSSVPFSNDSAAMPSTNLVNEIIPGDFDGDLRTDMVLLRGALRPSEVEIFEGNIVEAQLFNGDRSFTFKSSGTLSVAVDWNKTFETFSNIWVGANGGHPSSENFILDPADPNVQGLKNQVPKDYAEIYFGYDASSQTWSVNTYSSGWVSLYITIESTEPVTDLDVLGIKAIEKPIKPAVFSNQPGGFVDVTADSGLDSKISCPGGSSGDFDNDGDLDLYLVCRGGVQNIENRMYENDGTGHFTLVANEGGANSPKGSAVTARNGTGDNVVIADYNMDGLLDMFVLNGLNMRPYYQNGGPDKMYRNVGEPRNWVQLDLVGTTSNRDGIGAVVYATAGGKTQLREQNGGFHRWSQDDSRIHFGLADSTSVDLEIHWPSGNVESYTNVASNKFYRVTESDDIEPLDLGGGGPGPGPGDECYSPTYSTSAAFGYYLWNDCDGSNKWNVRVTGGSSLSTVIYTGEIVADQNITDITSVSFEGNDILNASSDPKVLDFAMKARLAGDDGFSFVLPDGADACLNVSSAPSGNNLNMGSGQVLKTAPISLLTFEACDVAPPPPLGGDCGAPAFDPSQDDGILIYKDCGADNWHVRASSDSGFVIYTGTVTSDQTIQNIAGVSVEGSDTVEDNGSSVNFTLRVSNPWWDGFDFTASCSANTTFKVDSPSDTPVWIGANKSSGSTTISLSALPMCNP